MVRIGDYKERAAYTKVATRHRPVVAEFCPTAQRRQGFLVGEDHGKEHGVRVGWQSNCGMASRVVLVCYSKYSC